MKFFAAVAVALTAAAGVAAPSARAAICQTETMTCGTTMPIGGYCECRARGQTEGGDVVAKAKRPVNSTAGGCGADANDCRH
jgi:hypothetical protein